MRKGTLKIPWTNPIINCTKHSKGATVVIPVYKDANSLSEFEKKSIEQTISILGVTYDIALVCPEKLNVGEYKEEFSYDFNYFKVSDGFFVSRKSYSDLCENYHFYELFSEYEYMLICQPDAWIFENNLEHFISLGYDYIGAVHMLRADGNGGRVGNGGFSLRKVERFIEICKKTDFEQFNFNTLEDVVFSSRLARELKIADIENGFLFGWQEHPEAAFKKIKKLPMGCHNPIRNNWNFWRQYIKVEDAKTDREGQSRIIDGMVIRPMSKYNRNILRR